MVLDLIKWLKKRENTIIKWFLNLFNSSVKKQRDEKKKHLEDYLSLLEGFDPEAQDSDKKIILDINIKIDNILSCLNHLQDVCKKEDLKKNLDYFLENVSLIEIIKTFSEHNYNKIKEVKNRDLYEDIINDIKNEIKKDFRYGKSEIFLNGLYDQLEEMKCDLNNILKIEKKIKTKKEVGNYLIRVANHVSYLTNSDIKDKIFHVAWRAEPFTINLPDKTIFQIQIPQMMIIVDSFKLSFDEMCIIAKIIINDSGVYQKHLSDSKLNYDKVLGQASGLQVLEKQQDIARSTADIHRCVLYMSFIAIVISVIFKYIN